MKKLLFCLFFIVLFFVPARAAYTVDAVTVNAEASANGRTQVSMTVQLSFDAATTQVSIPLPTREASRISVSDYRFSREELDDGLNLLLTKKDGFVGAQTFSISYSVPYTDGGGDTEDVFSLGLLSSRWAAPVGSCTFQVVLPGSQAAAEEDASAPEPVAVLEPEVLSGYYGALSAKDTALTATETSFGGVVTDLMAYDSLSVSLTLPEGYFAVRSTTLPMISVTFLAMGMLGVWLLAVLYWRLKLRSGSVSVSSRLLAPEGILTCQLPMVLDGSTCDVAAMVLEWANLGYLSISVSRTGVVLLTRRMQMGSERSRAEQQLFSRIFGRKRRVAATPGRFSGSAARFRAASRRSLYRVIFDRRGGNPAFVQHPCRLLLAVGIGTTAYRLLPEGGGFVVLAVLIGLLGALYSLLLHRATGRFAALRAVTKGSVLCWAAAIALLAVALVAGSLPEMAVGLLACIFSGVATGPGPRRSQRGLDAMAQAKGCRAFYRKASRKRLHRLQERDSRFFQTQLPRAIALRSDKRFVRGFDTVPMPEWLVLGGSAVCSPVTLRRQLKPILRKLREAFR